MRVTVTGATGLIGRRLVAALRSAATRSPCSRATRTRRARRCGVAAVALGSDRRAGARRRAGGPRRGPPPRRRARRAALERRRQASASSPRARPARATSWPACAPPSRAPRVLVSAIGGRLLRQARRRAGPREHAARRRLPRRASASPGSARRRPPRDLGARVVHVRTGIVLDGERRRAGEDAAALQARRRRAGRRRRPVHALDPRRRPRRHLPRRARRRRLVGPVNARRARAGDQQGVLARRSGARCTGPPSRPSRASPCGLLYGEMAEIVTEGQRAVPERTLAARLLVRAPRPRRGPHRSPAPLASPPMSSTEKPTVDVPSDQPPSYQLELDDLEVGDGDEAVAGHIVEVHYVGVSWRPASSSTPPGTAATPSSSASARARSSRAGTRAWPA